MIFLKAVSLYFLILLSALQQWWLVGFMAVLTFSWIFGAGWLILAAFLVDAYFGNFYNVPFYSIAAILWFLVVSYWRPKLVRD